MFEKLVILAAMRSPIGRFNGALSALSAAEIQAQVIKQTLEKGAIEPGDVDQVVLGQVLTGGAGMNPARQAALAAGIPKEAPCMLVNQVCGSGLRSISLAAHLVASGEAGVILAGGQESMSQSPHILPHSRKGQRMGTWEMQDSMVLDGLWDAFHQIHMGVTAENLVQRFGIGRDEQDRFALKSHEKARSAQAAGKFADEIAPLRVPVEKNGAQEIAEDEGLDQTVTLDTLAALKPAFIPDHGTVTAGNSSKINDGASCVIVASDHRARELGGAPLARIKAFATTGIDPSIMGLGPVSAIRQCLDKAGWSLDDVDLVEDNEAFAAQSIAVNRELDWDLAKVNVNGGAIALGHPIGASGARILTTLLHEMVRRDAHKGLAALCVGGGMGVAMAIER